MINKIKKVTPAFLKEIVKDLAGHNFIKNHFNTRFDKNVLISYITKPLITGHSYSHTNYQEVIAIANVFKSLDYNTDIINYTKAKKYDLNHYDVVFGLGESVEFALQHRTKRNTPIVIWHGTGSSPFYSNKVTINRLKFSYDESGILLYESTRFIEQMYPLSYTYSDLIVLYGNEFTKGTYADHTYSTIETINPTTYFTHTPKTKTMASCSNYFWFGSAGAIHKGLDLLLHFFEKHPELNLHICGDLSREDRFYNYTKAKLLESPNIHYHGFVDVNSDRFKELMDAGVFSILPSCSEGIATSVLTTMANGGMIPIVTKNSGIDIHDYGILIEELTLPAIEKAIAASQKLSLEEINRRSAKIISHARQNFTIENFSENLKKILIKYLDK